jgi:hypothetical protein
MLLVPALLLAPAVGKPTLPATLPLPLLPLLLAPAPLLGRPLSVLLQALASATQPATMSIQANDFVMSSAALHGKLESVPDRESALLISRLLIKNIS